MAAALTQRAEPGERALLLLPSGPDYVAAFFACLYAGVIAVPAYPPESMRPQHLERLLSIIDDAEPGLILTTAQLLPALSELTLPGDTRMPALLAVDQLDAEQDERWSGDGPRAQDIAFLQYTSGSTATPKGVQVSNGNLEANAWLIRQGYEIDNDDVIVSWLPHRTGRDRSPVAAARGGERIGGDRYRRARWQATGRVCHCQRPRRAAGPFAHTVAQAPSRATAGLHDSCPFAVPDGNAVDAKWQAGPQGPASTRSHRARS
jgi:hypothetical protein